MPLRFSSRTGWDVGESAFAHAIRHAPVPLLDLTVANPTRCGFEYDAEAILAPLADPAALRYDPDPRGFRSAREAVARYYAGHGAEVDPGGLLLTTSTSEAYGFLFQLLCDAGDEVLVPRPSYPLFDFLADLEDVCLRPYPLFYDFGWWIDFAQLERVITPRTRAILVVHPNNPTGQWTTATERDRLLEFCAQNHLALIVDEVFLDYPLVEKAEGETFAAGDPRVLMFVLSGMSKIAGLPQMKAAWVLTLGPEGTRTEALARLEVIADTFLSMNAPVQHALPAWLAGCAGIQRQILGRIRRNLRTLQASGMPVLKADAGWSAIVRTPRKAEELLSQHGVIVHPGAFYGMSEGNRIVVSLLTPEEEFAAGVALIAG